jgi:hypothetical protein
VEPAGSSVPPSDGLALVVRLKICTKLAVTVWSSDMATTQVPTPEQESDQLEKIYPLDATGVTVTWVPEGCELVPDGDRVPPSAGLAVVVRLNVGSGVLVGSGVGEGPGVGVGAGVGVAVGV